MPRRLASHVHLTTARLLQSKVLATPPVWYNAVMMYPPIPLPPRDPVYRPRYYREKDLDEKAGMGRPLFSVNDYIHLHFVVKSITEYRSTRLLIQ